MRCKMAYDIADRCTYSSSKCCRLDTCLRIGERTLRLRQQLRRLQQPLHLLLQLKIDVKLIHEGQNLFKMLKLIRT